LICVNVKTVNVNLVSVINMAKYKKGTLKGIETNADIFEKLMGSSGGSISKLKIKIKKKKKKDEIERQHRERKHREKDKRDRKGITRTRKAKKWKIQKN
tara:strand:- start:1797 stop:2093 length:297 start_codon:yes stop_codon:yes gene_type:complete